jgi:hypothetical protein
VLAGLAQTPTDPKWAFDFVPAKKAAAKRRGRRGRKGRGTKRIVPKQFEELDGNKLSEVCERVIALRPWDEEAPDLSPKILTRDESRLTIPLATFSAESIRHHWAPQFRPKPSSIKRFAHSDPDCNSHLHKRLDFCPLDSSFSSQFHKRTTIFNRNSTISSIDCKTPIRQQQPRHHE